MLRNFMLHGSNTFLILACAALVVLAAAGLVHLSLWFVAIGALVFYLSEYGTHRFMFHAPPSRIAWVRAKQHRLHYDHHVEPMRLDLLFLPLWYVIPNTVVIGFIAYLILGNMSQVFALVLGSYLALLHYEWVHFIAHQPYTPVTAFGRWMKRYHLRHHFVNEKLWFGVSNPSMDFVYRTYRDLNDAPRSKTTKILYPGENTPR
jgi:4-hydroxysphinganine ceramide fatty acyl 2-hydroxylase